MWQNLNCDKTQIVTKLKNLKRDNPYIVTKLKNLIVRRLKNLNGDKTWIRKNVNVWSRENLKGSFSKNILTPKQPMRCSLGRVLQFLQCLKTAHGQKFGKWIHKLCINLCTKVTIKLICAVSNCLYLNSKKKWGKPFAICPTLKYLN